VKILASGDTNTTTCAPKSPARTKELLPNAGLLAYAVELSHYPFAGLLFLSVTYHKDRSYNISVPPQTKHWSET